VKPANVLLARRDHAYLSDFGLAKHASSAGDLTRQETVIARAGYAAPEQITGDRVDARADVYALGCLLFETLTGEAPFASWKGGPTVMAHVEAPPPSPLELRPDLPPDFDEVVRRAMAKDPSERYASAGDLGEAALAAAGGLRPAGEEAVVATGEAAPSPGVAVPADAEAATAGGGGRAGRLPGGAEALRWGVALGALVVLFICMMAALGAIDKL
jgi:hypothetical protein